MGCPICNHDSAQVNPCEGDNYQVCCLQCGEFKVTYVAKVNLKTTSEGRWKVSAWLNQYLPALLTAEDVEIALSSMPPSLHTRADRMLRWISKNFPAGESFSLAELRPTQPEKETLGGAGVLGERLPVSRLIPVGWNKSLNEMDFMVTEVLCNELGVLVSQNNHDYQVSPKGLFRLEGKPNQNSQIGFCAMWFDNKVVPLWTQVIEPAVRSAGYEPLRIDSKQHNEKIDDEIVASIRSARFIVADFTGHRGGVYYEAGFAHGLGLPVIFMCRSNHLKKLHFDIRQYNCIVWTSEDLDAAQFDLKNRILATLGQGPLKTE